MASKMYIEKSLEYTVKGIEILRNETIQLFQNRNNYLSFGTGAIALFFYSAATSQYNYPFLTYVVLLLAIPLLSCFLIIISLYINVQIVNLCRYLRSREMILTYLLESVYKNEGQRVFDFKNKKNLIQEKIRRLFFEKNKDEKDLPIQEKIRRLFCEENKEEMILRNQIPIYWEGYMLNPIPDKFKVIDLQSYMITWMFSIIALISYCTALIFRVSIETRCTPSPPTPTPTPTSTPINWKCPTQVNTSDSLSFNDIYFFSNHNFGFFQQYSDFFREYSWFKNLTSFLDSDTQILFVVIFILTVAYVASFWLRLKVPEKIKNHLVEIGNCLIQKVDFILPVFIILLVIAFIIILCPRTPSLFKILLSFFVGSAIIVMMLFFNIFGEILKNHQMDQDEVRKELTSTKIISRDFYSLFLNLTSFVIVMYFLRFHTELSVFIIILSTFSYSIFWQIPQFRKTAYRPLNKDIFVEEKYFD